MQLERKTLKTNEDALPIPSVTFRSRATTSTQPALTLLHRQRALLFPAPQLRTAKLALLTILLRQIIKANYQPAPEPAPCTCSLVDHVRFCLSDHS